MFDSWYQNVGKLLQRIARIGFAIEAVCCMIGGIILAFVALVKGSFLGFLLMPIAAFLAIIAAFLASLPLYGMGILIESAEINIENNARTVAERTTVQKSQKKQQNTSNRTSPHSHHFCKKCGCTLSPEDTYCKKCGKTVSSESTSQDNSTQPSSPGVIVTPNQQGRIICPICQAEQLSIRQFCFRCNTRFIKLN